MTTQPTRSMDTYGPEDMAIPEMKLIQNVGGTEAKALGAQPGDFYCNITGEIITEGFDIVVVDVRKNRTYWGRTEIEDEPPICASLDAHANMQGEECAQCPYDVRCDTPWLLDAAERRTKCLLNYSILAIDVRNQLPLLIRASGISTQAVRELLTALRLNKQLRGEYHRALVHVSSLAKKTAQGEVFAMVLRSTGLITEPQQIEELKIQSLQLLGVKLLPEGVTTESPVETIPEEATPPEKRVAPPVQPAKTEPEAKQASTPTAPAAEKITKVVEPTPAVKEEPAAVKPIDTEF